MIRAQQKPGGSPTGRWNLWDWIVAAWVIFLDWLFELAQWALSNIVPQFKNGTLHGALLAGLAFGGLTLLIRLVRNNQPEQQAAVFPLTPPDLRLPRNETPSSSSAEARSDAKQL